MSTLRRRVRHSTRDNRNSSDLQSSFAFRISSFDFAAERHNANTSRWDGGIPSQWKSTAATKAPAEFLPAAPYAARYQKYRTIPPHKHSTLRLESPAPVLPP